MSQPAWIAAAALSPLTPDVLFQQGEFERARVWYRALQQSTREMFALLRLDRWQEAIVVGEHSRVPSPEHEGLLALAYLRGGQPERASECAQAALRRDLSAYWPLVARGTLAVRWEADPAAAREYLRQATQRRPEIAEGWLGLLAATRDAQEITKITATLASLAPKGYPFDFWSRPLRQESQNALRVLQAFPEGQLFSSVSTFSSEQTLALKRDPRGMLYFDAEVDGQRLRLLYDTGAGRHFLLTPQALKKLKPAFVSSAIVTGLQGQSVGQLHRAERLQLGTLELKTLLVESAPSNLGGFDGLIGWRIFGERVQQLNLREKTLTLRDKPDPRAPRGIEMPLHLIAEQPVIGVLCQRMGKPSTQVLWAILDTGSERDFFSLRAGALLTARYRREVLKGSLGVGQSHPHVETRSFNIGYDLSTVNHEPLTSYSQGTAASFLDTVHNPLTGFEHSLLLGMDFISRFSSMELDPVARRVRFVPS